MSPTILYPLRDAGEPARARPESTLRYVSDHAVGVNLLGATREWESTAASIARLAVETFCDWSIVDIIDEAGEQRRVAVDHADPTKAALAAEIREYPPNPAVTPATSEIIRAGRSLLASIVPEREIDARARDNRQAELARKLGLASYIVSPLVARGRVLGTVSFIRVNRKRPFAQSEVSRAEEIAHQAALAIDNARLAAEARTSAERIARLQNVTAALSEAASPEKVVDAVLEQTIASLEDVATGGVWRLSADRRTAELIGCRNFDPDSMRKYQTLPLERPSPMSHALLTGEAVWLQSREEYADRYPASPALALLPTDGYANTCLPLVVEGRVLGGISFTFRGKRLIDPGERAFLLAIARQCAQALDRAQLYEKERSARAQAEAANRMLQAVVASAPIGITMLNPDATVRMWNPAAERILGWSEQEVLGRAVPTLTELSGEELLRNLNAALAGNPVVAYEALRYRKDGTPLTAAIWMSPVESGEGTRVLAMILDVSERRRNEEWLRSLAQASEVLASSLDYEKTLQAVTRLAVPALGELAIVDGPLLDGSPPLVVTSVNPRKAELIREMRRRYAVRDGDAISVAVRTGESRLYVHPPMDVIRRFAVDAEHARMIEECGTRSSLVVPLKARGQTLGVFSLVSCERIYEARDLAFAEELARRAAIAIDNARLYRDLQEAARAREDFLSIAGHALRTPLTALHLQLLSVVRLAERGEAHDRIAERAGRAVRNMDRLLALSNDLLDTSWISGRQLALERSELDLVEEVGEVLARLHGELTRAGCVAVLDADSAVRGRWDRPRLTQLLAGLLSNAMKYGAGKPIRVRVRAVDGRAVLTVRDQGIGIPLANQALIFNRFERAGAASHYGGLGLGLWIARRIVEAHGGTIEVESAPGEGATFRVELPCKPTVRDPAGAAAG